MNSQENSKSLNENERLIAKFNKIQDEILRIGWKGILENYHPDSNIDHPEASKLFQLYKEIYETMQKRLILDVNMPELQ